MPLVANAAGVGQQVVLLEPGGIHEACMQLTTAEQLHYSFTASEELNFNIHYHAGNTVHFPLAEHPASRADTNFIPDSDQHYCLMWTNASDTPVELNTQHEIVAGSP